MQRIWLSKSDESHMIVIWQDENQMMSDASDSQMKVRWVKIIWHHLIVIWLVIRQMKKMSDALIFFITLRVFRKYDESHMNMIRHMTVICIWQNPMKVIWFFFASDKVWWIVIWFFFIWHNPMKSHMIFHPFYKIRWKVRCLYNYEIRLLYTSAGPVW